MIGLKKESTHLLEYFKNWSALRIAEKEVMKKKFGDILILRRIKCTSRHFSIWLQRAQEKESAIVRHYDNTILRRCVRDWRMMKPVRLVKENLGIVCGVHRVYLSRAWHSWKGLSRKKCNMAYALSLLRTTLDRMRARKALLNWPGWREHRKSEDMKRRLIVKHIERSHLLNCFNRMAREDKQKSHSAVTAGITSVPNAQIKRLTLAERVAVEAVHLLCPKNVRMERSRGGSHIDELTFQTVSYHTALSLANKQFMRRKAATQVRRMDVVVEGTIVNSDKNITNTNTNSTTNKDSMKNKDNWIFETDILASLVDCSSREELAVKELLLFMQIVFIAWRKVAKNIRVKRVKIRQVVHARGKVSALHTMTSHLFYPQI